MFLSLLGLSLFVLRLGYYTHSPFFAIAGGGGVFVTAGIIVVMVVVLIVGIVVVSCRCVGVRPSNCSPPSTNELLTKPLSHCLLLSLSSAASVF